MSDSPCAHLFYGLTVRASDLVAAGKAYSRLEPVLRTIKLIALRRRRGLLAGTRGKQPVLACVPAEVWELVRADLMRSEVEAARLSMMEDLTGEGYPEKAAMDEAEEWHYDQMVGCGNNDSDEDSDEYAGDIYERAVTRIKQEGIAYRTKYVWADDWIERNHPGRCFTKGDPTGIVQCDWIEELNSLAARQLLNDHGLCYPSSAARTSYDDCDSGITSATSMIALHRSNLASPRVRCDSIIKSAIEDFVNPPFAPIDPSFFTLPANADARFSRFTRHFSIARVPSGATQHHPSTRTAERDGGPDVATTKEVKEVKPGWFLGGTVPGR